MTLSAKQFFAAGFSCSCRSPAAFHFLTPAGLTPQDWHPFMVGAVAPRPIAFASPIDAAGRVNLSPCFFNTFRSLERENGAGNLGVCRVVRAHFRQDIVLPTRAGIDPFRLAAVARLGGDWYARLTPESLFEVPKPNRKLGIGIDEIPEFIRHSEHLSGNHLGRLGNIERESLPPSEAVNAFRAEPIVAYVLNKYRDDAPERQKQLTLLGRQLLDEGRLLDAWKVLLLSGVGTSPPGPLSKKEGELLRRGLAVKS